MKQNEEKQIDITIGMSHFWLLKDTKKMLDLFRYQKFRVPFTEHLGDGDVN